MIIPPDNKNHVEDEISCPSPLHRLPHRPSSTHGTYSSTNVQRANQRPVTSPSPADSVPTTDEPTEETPLLAPPPSYSEAVSQSGKAGKGRKARYLAIGLSVFLCAAGVIAGLVVVRHRWREDPRQGWERGGLDGKGKFDHRWQHRTPFLTSTPLLANESDPRECDLFSEPRLIDSWRNGATALPIYESTAEYLFPLNDRQAADNLWVHVRGSKAYGGVYVLGPGTEIIDIERPPTGKVKVAIKLKAENVSDLNDWHFCRAGDDGRQGIAIVGPNDGSRPVSSPWLEGYMRFQVDIIFPFEVSADPGASESSYLLESLVMHMQNMGVTFSGDLQSVALAKDVRVTTTNAPLVLTNALTADSVRFDTTNGNIAAQAIAAREDIILHTENALIACQQCTANSSFITIHNENGRVTGSYRAGESIDVVTSGQEVKGQFHSPRIWVKNDEGSINAHFSGLLPEDENGSLLALTSFGRVVASIDFAHLQTPKKGRTWQDHVGQHSKVPVRLGTQSSDIIATITNLPPHAGIAMEAEVPDGDISVIAPDQVQAVLDVTVSPSGVVTIDLGDEKSRANKRLNMDRRPSEDGHWRGPVHGALTYRRYPPGSSIPVALSSLSLVSTQYANLTL